MKRALGSHQHRFVNTHLLLDSRAVPTVVRRALSLTLWRLQREFDYRRGARTHTVAGGGVGGGRARGTESRRVPSGARRGKGLPPALGDQGLRGRMEGKYSVEGGGLK